MKVLFEKIHDLMTTGTVSDEGVGKLAVFAGVRKFPARVKCTPFSAGMPCWPVAVEVEGWCTVSTENESN